MVVDQEDLTSSREILVAAVTDLLLGERRDGLPRSRPTVLCVLGGCVYSYTGSQKRVYRGSSTSDSDYYVDVFAILSLWEETQPQYASSPRLSMATC